MPASTAARSALVPPAALPTRGTPRWFWNRLRAMERAEVVHRLGRALRAPLDRMSTWAGVRVPPVDRPQRASPDWVSPLVDAVGIDWADTLHRADQILAGQWTLLDGSMAMLGLPPPWSARSPADLAPARVAPGPETPAENQHDVRLLIELHRHGELVVLARAWAQTRDARYRQAAMQLLASWLVACPPGVGAGWSSALEPAMRLINWSLAWPLLAAPAAHDADDAGWTALMADWQRSAYLHARFVRRHFSRYSSANNHLLGEMVGLFVAGLTWPQWHELRDASAQARAELERQFLLQHADDGGSREQSTGYAIFNLELMTIAAAAAAALDRPLSGAVQQRMHDTLGFLDALADARGHLPALGDADNCRVLDSARGDGDLAYAARLLGRQGHTPGATAGRSVTQARTASGYVILGHGRGTTAEVRATVDCGALGFLGIAAHGHADALALLLSLGGTPVLVDRGTYCYNSAPAARRYFRSTLAHNTVTVDGQPQSEYGGPFLWLRKAQCRLLRFAGDDRAAEFEGEHDGYLHLADPLRHRRRVLWDADGARLAVTDILDCHAAHDIAIAWHFAAHCQVTIDEDTAVVRLPDRRELRLESTPAGGAPGGHWHLFCGPQDSWLGWHSPHFGQAIPAPTLLWEAAIHGTTTIVTTFHLPPPAAD